MPEMVEVGDRLAHREELLLDVERSAKEAVDRGYQMRLEDGLGLEGDLYAILQTTADRMEGITAFHERRPPRYLGE